MKRISHSLLDPLIGPLLQGLYPILRIPKGFPPEGIVLTGHLSAILGAVGFSYATNFWWGGLLLALGVTGNHTADCLDGKHARTTGQCRNGGELLDHFTDPLSFSYWLVGWAIAVNRLDLGLAAVIILFATAVLTNIKAKMLGEFTLATFGPTEFKALLVLFGLVLAYLTGGAHPSLPPSQVALYVYFGAIGLGAIQLIVGLYQAVVEVNERGSPPDTTEWVNTRDE